MVAFLMHAKEAHHMSNTSAPILLTRDCLLGPLQKVIGVVEKKQTMPILSNVQMTIEQDTVSFIGTDSEVELRGEALFISQTPVETIRLTLPGRKLADICRALPDNAAIELYQENECVVLRSGKSRFTLSTLPADDFPTIERESADVEFTLSQTALKSLLQQTQAFMAHQDVRYYLNGLLLTTSDNTLIAAATDGHRLAKAWIANAPVSDDIHIIIPRKGVMELLRLLSDSDEPVTVRVGKNHIAISSPQFSFISKLIDGRFPDYSRVIPKKTELTLPLDRDQLKEALQRVMILCSEKHKAIRFEFREGLLTITANNPQLESAEESIPLDYHKEPMDIGFNIKYLLDTLHTIPSGPITLSLNGPDQSVLFESQADKETGVSSLFVIMPMRL